MSELEQMASAARDHASNVSAEISLAMTRQEHIRLTRLAIEAENLAVRLETLVSGVAV